VETLEVALYESKKRLMHVSRNYDKYSEEELREAYEMQTISGLSLP